MESSRRDFLNDVAEHKSILKNNQNTYHRRLSFTPKTGVELHKTVCGFSGVNFMSLQRVVYILRLPGSFSKLVPTLINATSLGRKSTSSHLWTSNSCGCFWRMEPTLTLSREMVSHPLWRLLDFHRYTNKHHFLTILLKIRHFFRSYFSFPIGKVLSRSKKKSISRFWRIFTFWGPRSSKNWIIKNVRLSVSLRGGSEDTIVTINQKFGTWIQNVNISSRFFFDSIFILII